MSCTGLAGDDIAYYISPMTDDIAPLTGIARIQAYLKTLPDAPGVYRMMDAKGDVLYVGKAKSLKKRVASYAKSGGHTERIARMIAETAEMLFVTTASETEALLLESNLIKRLKPRYNVSFRDDKSFPNILLREDHPFRAAFEASRRQDREGRLFRTLRQCRRGQPHAQHAAARVSAALLFGFGVRGAHAALPVVPDQALQRALRRAHRRGGLWRAGATKPNSFSPAKAARCRTTLVKDMKRLPRRSISSRRRGCATGCARCSQVQSHPGHQSQHFR